MRLFVLLAILTVPQAANASMDETLDISVHATAATLEHDGLRSFDVQGGAARVGVTLGSLRFGGGPTFLTAPSVRTDGGSRVDRPMLAGGELFVGIARPDGCVLPFLELRAHAERWIGSSEGLGASLGIGPRIGLRFVLNEYFFAEVGVGRDVLGPERFRTGLALGIPIPLSHL